jgi:hypothetical protein
MKKITFIIALVSMGLINLAHAEEKGFALFSNDTPSQNDMIASQYQTMDETDPGSPGNASPIDFYLPGLLAVGLGMAFYVGRKRKSAIE